MSDERRRYRLTLCAIAIASLGAFALGRAILGPAGRAPTCPVRTASLAVLPFEDLAAPGYGRMVAGLLTTALSQVDGLVVASRQHVDAGRLRVACLVTGTVSAAGDSIVVVATLIDVGSGQRRDVEQLAGHDVFELVDRLARRVRVALPDGGLGEQPIPPVSSVTTDSPVAYRHFLDGWRHLGRDDRAAARRSFEAAVAADPGFALALHGLMLSCDPEAALRHAARALDLLHRATPADQQDIVGLAGTIMRAGLDGDGTPPLARPRRVTDDVTGLFMPRALPVLPLGESCDSGHAEYPSVIEHGDALWMYYAAFGDGGHWAIALATSEDGGGTWLKRGVVLEPDPTPGAWDGDSVAFPEVVVDGRARHGERFRLYYAGKGGADYRGIGLATSRDGMHWTRHGQVLAAGEAGAWDAAEIVDPAIIRVGDVDRMYYCGAPDRAGRFAIGLATSPDGSRFEKTGPGPVYALDGSTRLYTVDILPVGERIILFESSVDETGFFDIHAVPSPDGLHFDPAARRRVLAASRDGSWDHAMVYGMDAVVRDDTVHLWFNGIYQRMVTPGGQVGWATAGLAPFLESLALPVD